MSGSQSTSNHSNAKQTKHEGPKKHIVAYIFSLVLTYIAFIIVMSGEINKDFTYIMLIVLAIVQVFVQMAFWMHMKDRGHTFAKISIITGVFVVLTCIIMALYWTRW